MVVEHFIPTTGNPVKIPPRRIPGNYRVEVQQQINTMLQQGIIEPTSSPWMALRCLFARRMGKYICVLTTGS